MRIQSKWFLGGRGVVPLAEEGTMPPPSVRNGVNKQFRVVGPWRGRRWRSISALSCSGFRFLRRGSGDRRGPPPPPPPPPGAPPPPPPPPPPRAPPPVPAMTAMYCLPSSI